MTIVERLRLSEKNEGHISNPHRVLDGFLAELPHEMPIVEMDL